MNVPLLSKSIDEALQNGLTPLSHCHHYHHCSKLKVGERRSNHVILISWAFADAQVRMPSQMVGKKTMLTEGGNRNYLLVAGPGIHAGATDYSLTSIKDLMATTVALGGGGGESVGDGLNIENLLYGATGSESTAVTDAQAGRMLMQLKPGCFWPDLVPELGSDR